jgi:hypothetical protein
MLAQRVCAAIYALKINPFPHWDKPSGDMAFFFKALVTNHFPTGACPVVIMI